MSLDTMGSESVVDFYNGLAELYHLVYADWHASVRAQGARLAAVIRERWNGSRLLDAACGIGTQALGLAVEGFDVAASDLSPAAVERARREAAALRLDIRFAVADLRELTTVHAGPFDVVIACDNAIPHLQTDADILRAFREMRSSLRPGGGCVISVRDYASIARAGTHLIPFGIRRTAQGRVAVFQVWDFTDPEHYDLGMFFVFDLDTRPRLEVFRSRYHAVLISQLEMLLRQAEFVDIAVLTDCFFQPILVASNPA